MATLTMTPPTRQPFASLDTPRMRPIMRSKLNFQNIQNSVSLSKKSSIYIEDSENIDPYTRSLSAKRKRTLDDDEISKGSPKPVKASRISLSTRATNNVSSRFSTPLKTIPSTPKSAPMPKPAGRTPPSKSSKAPGRRSAIAKARPGSAKRAVARPFSLASALVQAKPAAPKPVAPKSPTGWFFDIHVDSEQEEMTNLMQHSTGVLDISDDEGKASSIADERGKENVPPSELGIDLPRSSQAIALAAAAEARKVEKMEEDRAPLGELTASDYYPEDCNAFSYAVIYDDENGPPAKITPVMPPPSTFGSPEVTTSIDSLLKTALPPKFEDKKEAAPKEDRETAHASEDKTESF
ncbi:hypothetical protein N7466_000980 [Penicillium verhagenii]|uniref:uncharacterized protein n=1 Tax=Penicillium verhagenii TaxID=1562060 RepID=UPI002544FBB1|nr:uncharacterized protein N7466_000980 [Penicillium verhagenii]KAJ5947965.1 hypothetical protein N7466_000980 [Penicillium verhagenii]